MKRILGAVLLGALPAAPAAALQENPSSYPRTAAEIKAILGALAGKRGSIPDEFIARLQQYRFLCGVPFEDLGWNPEQAELAYYASFLCARLDRLTHEPPRPPGVTDREYERGRKGAAECNLFAGRTSPRECVDGWMDDSDARNIARVGHRRWILNPTMGSSGFGAFGRYAAMYAHDASRASVPDWDFVAYPARGFMPLEFFSGFSGPRRAWSVSPHPAKFRLPDRVEVTVVPVDGRLAPRGAPLRVDSVNVDRGGFGSGPAIIFRPLDLTLAHDALFRVEILGTDPPLRYLVHFIAAARVPDGPETAAALGRFFQARHARILSIADPVDRAQALADLLESEGSRGMDPRTRAAVQKSLSELLRDPAVRREHDASARYRQVARLEQEAGTDRRELARAAAAYRDLARACDGTRAGRRAAQDFERLKAQLQQP